jgi:chemotaxis protein MotB
MGTTTKLAQWFGVAAAGGLVLTGSVGCVGTKEYHNVRAERDAAVIQRDAARAQASGLQAEVDGYKGQIGAMMADTSKDATITNLTGETAELRNQLAQLNARYADAMDRPAETTTTGGAMMPAALKAELAAFAAKHKDLVEFDANKGVVRFKSDAAFAPGSSDLTPRGKDAAKKLAAILSSSAGAGFELMVAGHTDGTPISKPSTIKAGHKDNWHLSAHRAIAVGQVFQGNHVHPRRLAMVGYAEHRPVASNATPAGRSQNRRVEVLVMGTKLSPSDLAVKPARKVKSTKGDFNKDASASTGWNK